MCAEPGCCLGLGRIARVVIFQHSHLRQIGDARPQRGFLLAIQSLHIAGAIARGQRCQVDDMALDCRR